MTNQFTERYKSYSNAELLNIIENSSDYQPEAVKTAQYEIDQRQLTDEDFMTAKSELQTQRIEKDKQTEKRQEFENKAKEFGQSIFGSINPIQQSTPSTEKYIRIITIVFGLISIFTFYNEYGMLEFMFGNRNSEWDLSMILYFFPLLFLPTTTLFFWLRKKIGWILLGVYLIHSAATNLMLLLLNWNNQSYGIQAFDAIFPQPSSLTYFLSFLFFTGTMWVICKEDLRAIYHINKKTMILTIAIMVIPAITLFLLYP